MPDEPTSTEDVSEYGLPLEEFKVAVDALIRLRDEGKVLLFYTRRSALRLIGDDKDFQAAFAAHLRNDEAVTRFAKIQNEIQSVVTHALQSSSLENAARYMGRLRFNEDMDENSENWPVEKREFFTLQLAKLNIASRALLPEGVRERIARLATSTAPCLEDLDYEVIQGRTDSLRHKKVAGPFLRLRLRYSDVRQEQYLGGILFGGPGSAGIASSFEVECDLSDIDLLLKRLMEAKQQLLGSEPQEGEEE